MWKVKCEKVKSELQSKLKSDLKSELQSGCKVHANWTLLINSCWTCLVSCHWTLALNCSTELRLDWSWTMSGQRTWVLLWSSCNINWIVLTGYCMRFCICAARALHGTNHTQLQLAHWNQMLKLQLKSGQLNNKGESERISKAWSHNKANPEATTVTKHHCFKKYNKRR